jgi:TrpR-related protein YerC/YecD
MQENEECKSFFYDLCTPSEIEEFSTRWLIVKLLTKKKTCRQIAHETSVITTTISRVARFMKHGNDGYNSILNKLTVNK